MIKTAYRLVLKIILGFFILSLGWVLLYRFVPVTWTPLMLKRSIENIGSDGYRNHRTWVDIEDISPVMVRAVLASEDGRFMEHWGFDLKELSKMTKEHKTKGRKIRGCSTISQQVAKNCFTFCGRSWWRKCFEAYYTVLIEAMWSKERIMEVYLNSIEMGPRLYGAEAVAQQHFGKPAAKLTRSECALVAATWPNPKRYSSKNPSSYMRRRQSAILKQMQLMGK